MCTPPHVYVSDKATPGERNVSVIKIAFQLRINNKLNDRKTFPLHVSQLFSKPIGRE